MRIIMACAAAVSLSAAVAQTPHRFTVTLNYSGEPAENVPTLLRISEKRISGFSYGDTADGTDFEIRDENGNLLPYEIDTWDPSGESLLWVKVPSFAGGKTLTVSYGMTSDDMTKNAADVWSGYAGVWHMNALDSDGKYPDSASDRDAEVSSFSKTGQDGKFGQSVLIYTNAWHAAKGTEREHEKGGVFIPDGGTLDLSEPFTLSGWFNHRTVKSETDSTTYAFRYDNIFCKRGHVEPSKNNPTDPTGFGVRVDANAPTISQLAVYTQTSSASKEQLYLKNGSWTHVRVSFAEGAVQDNDNPLVVGNTTVAYLDNGGDRAWGGYADEVRLISGTPSAGYLAAEYAAMADDALVIYGPAESMCRALTIDRNTYFSDSVTVSSDQPAVSDGVYLIGTTVTLTALPAAGGAFRKWYGDVAKEDRTKPTISFTVTDDVWIYARFVHPWTLAPDKKTMTDGNFTVNVTDVNDGQHTLTIGRTVTNPTGPGLLADESGSGVIDLGGPILLEGDDTPWIATSLAYAKSAQTISTGHPGKVRAYISPGTLTVNNYYGQCFHCGDNNALVASSYEMIIIDEPAVKKFFNPYLLVNQVDLKKLIFDLPRVAAADHGHRMFYGLNKGLVDTKFDWWDLTSVTAMTNTFFACSWGGTSELHLRAPCTGNLSLPNLRGVDWIPGLGTQLYMMPGVEGISLGGAAEDVTVTNLCTYAFAGNSSLKKLVLHASADMRVGKRIFADHTHNAVETVDGVAQKEEIDGVFYDIGIRTSRGRVPDEIHFTGPAISSEAISNLLDAGAVVDTAAKPVVIYASRCQTGWGRNGVLADWISAATEAEKAAYPGEIVIGVYRAGAAEPSGKAVILHRPNDWDVPPGLTIILH